VGRYITAAARVQYFLIQACLHYLLTTNMSQLLILPTPLPASSFALGQLVVDPLATGSDSFNAPSEPECKSPVASSQYKDLLSHDDQGRFISSVSRKSASKQDSTVQLSAEKMSHTSLASPTAAFDALRRDTASHSFLRKMALQKQPLYYVTGVQRLTKPSFKQAAAREAGSTTDASGREFSLPSHVRRDCGNIEKRNNSDEVVFAVELMKVRARLGAKDEPHTLEDIDYDWSYHSLDEPDSQLSIGLGRELEARELRALAGIVSEEDFADEGYDTHEDEDEGLAGF
jgi:hypothetical protein